jgi:hypothetical protein
MTPIIRKFVLKLLSKDRGSGITSLPGAQHRMIQESIITDTLLKKGVNPESITSEGMLQSILNGIKKEEAMIARSKAEAQKQLATVMDMKGRKIRPGAKIMGGEEVVETEAEIAERLGKGNKQAVENIKEKQLIESFDPDEMATGGRAGYFIGGKVGAGILKLLKNKKKVKAAYDDIFPSGDYKYDAEMVAESLVENNPKVFGNRLYSDLNDAERFEVYGAALNEASTNFAKTLQMKRALRKASKPTKTLEGIEKTGIIDISDPDIAEEFARFMKETDPEGSKVIEQTVELSNFNPKGRKKNATGGRAGFAAGGMGRRAFLKLMAALGATGAAAKTGLVSLLGKGAGKEVAKEVVKESTTRPPEYFFRLVEKIKFMGDDTLASQDKAIAKKYKDYTMEEDFAGNIEIIKKGGDDMYPEDVYMSYQVDEVPLKGKKGSRKVEEYEEYTARPDQDGKMKDVEPGVPDEVIKEAGDTSSLTLKEKADGGRVSRWMGGGLSKGKRTLSELLKMMAKDSSHGKTPSEMLKMINPKQFNEMLDRPEGIPSIAREMIEKYTKEMKGDRANMIEELIATGRRIKKVDDDLVNYKIKIVEDMVSKGMDRATAKEMAETLAEMVAQGAGKRATPKITDEGLLELENIGKNLATKDRKLNASGGIARMLGE